MSLTDSILFNSLLDLLANGLWDASMWQVVAFTLITTHITICSVTIFLHRHQSHRALELHPAASHFFRFWLWIGTGMVTKEFVAIHRKHHAKCETEEDPHSPQVRGLKALLLRGTELYRQEALNKETLEKYGHGTPDDWLERHVYSRFLWQGVGLMLILDIALFGAIGATVWAIQMAWIPVMATGVINGIGHYWGYRNFESPDASTNVVWWGILIGGEELHNNHHTYPTSAKFSVRRYEFDVAWLYISLLVRCGLAKVRKTPPKLVLGTEAKAVVDRTTLDVVIANRYEIMARLGRDIRHACRRELRAVRAKGGADVSRLGVALRWLHRDETNVPDRLRPVLVQVRHAYPVLNSMVHMREELRELWTNTNRSREQLVDQLRTWCERAEASSITALQQFSTHLRCVEA